LGIVFEWEKIHPIELPRWYDPYETAQIVCQGKRIGIAGKINPAFYLNQINNTSPSDAFIFELDASFLATVHVPYKRFGTISKYPPITRDVSFMIPVATTVAQLQNEIAHVDSTIKNVTLVDFFQKPEWHDQKSITLRITMQDPQATLESAKADAIMQNINAHLISLGGQIR